MPVGWIPWGASIVGALMNLAKPMHLMTVLKVSTPACITVVV
jgi:hypothetical protein